MQFRISNDLEASENSDKVLTVSATGGKAIKLKLTDESGNLFVNNNNLKTGTAIIGHISTNSAYFDLTVEAEQGNYITVGSKITIDGKSDVNVLKANGHEVNGYLERDVLEKECYLIHDPTDSRIKNSFIVAIFNTSAVISYKDVNFTEIENTAETITKGYYSDV